MEKVTLYDFPLKDLQGNPVDIAPFRGKVILVVNTASGCGLTPQLGQLEALYQEFRDQGLEILAFPSNDFAGQEPLEGMEIQSFCSTQFGTSFPLMEKVHVIGKEVHPLFRYLSSKEVNGRFNSRPKWNFHKYLLDRNGQVVDYFYPITKPGSARLKKAIRKLLQA